MSCPQLARIGQLLVPWMMTLDKILFTRPLFFGGVPYSHVGFACSIHALVLAVILNFEFSEVIEAVQFGYLLFSFLEFSYLDQSSDHSKHLEHPPCPKINRGKWPVSAAPSWPLDLLPWATNRTAESAST